ncbi:MAG: hypothetical protein PWQ96_2414 [Clostridia bacterium]|nr:hypothetical protein [Clostridia bacterium]
MGYKGRDVEVIPLGDDKCLVAACDSCGAIGSKELDVVNVPNYVVGRFTTRVALLEVMSTAASPWMITVAVSNEPCPTGEEILEGVKYELKAVDLSSLPLAISTEKNMPTKQTGLGITVVGICDSEKLRIATSQPGDILYCLGLPKVGPEVKNPDDPEIVQGTHIQKLLETPGIHDVVMVGSKGVRKEAEILAENVKGHFELETSGRVDVDKSAGPSTCLIFTQTPDISPPDFSLTPLSKIGRIVPDSG